MVWVCTSPQTYVPVGCALHCSTLFNLHPLFKETVWCLKWLFNLYLRRWGQSTKSAQDMYAKRNAKDEGYVVICFRREW